MREKNITDPSNPSRSKKSTKNIVPEIKSQCSRTLLEIFIHQLYSDGISK